MATTNTIHTVRELRSAPPNRVWERTGHLNAYGHPMWASREWRLGELAEYRHANRIHEYTSK